MSDSVHDVDLKCQVVGRDARGARPDPDEGETDTETEEDEE